MRPIHGEPLSVLLESKGAADAAPLYLLGSMVAGARFELWKRPLKFEFLLTY